MNTCFSNLFPSLELTTIIFIFKRSWDYLVMIRKHFSFNLQYYV